MKKYTSYAMAILLCVVMAGAAFAVIGSSGGTEDFESVGSLTDATNITEALMPQISGWSYYETCAAPFFYYDNNDTSGFSTAAGAGTKPTGAGCLEVKSTGATADQHRIGGASMDIGRSITYSAWFAIKTTPVNNNARIGIHFPDVSATSNQASAHIEFCDGSKDLKLVLRSEILASGIGEFFVNGGASDDNDYALDTWNKLEITITTSESEAGEVTFSLNGSVIGQGAIISDAAGNLLSSRCFVLAWKSISSCDIYIDDIHVEADTGIDDWMLF